MPTLRAVYFSIRAGTLFNTLRSYQSDAFWKASGPVLAENDFAEDLFDGAFPLIATQMSKTLEIDR
ncbi:hypothetical protein DOTSEDRAFT_43627 [Dothistroma septosporum NZE10]|uniref:Uncharacterized protein n=1 Tax=Dothistroma septosporum (strain NZE10 / CBS 128990) TaxID=675120 RepID=N1PSB9_DOTSN|nr:hypothetical protein DOTSEDRAFT_43627 [Dothistroma septosporum NZE10]